MKSRPAGCFQKSGYRGSQFHWGRGTRPNFIPKLNNRAETKSRGSRTQAYAAMYAKVFGDFYKRFTNVSKVGNFSYGPGMTRRKLREIVRMKARLELRKAR